MFCCCRMKCIISSVYYTQTQRALLIVVVACIFNGTFELGQSLYMSYAVSSTHQSILLQYNIPGGIFECSIYPSLGNSLCRIVSLYTSKAKYIYTIALNDCITTFYAHCTLPHNVCLLKIENVFAVRKNTEYTF